MAACVSDDGTGTDAGANGPAVPRPPIRELEIPQAGPTWPTRPDRHRIRALTESATPTPASHPESPDRLGATWARLSETRGSASCTRSSAGLLRVSEALRDSLVRRSLDPLPGWLTACSEEATETGGSASWLDRPPDRSAPRGRVSPRLGSPRRTIRRRRTRPHPREERSTVLSRPVPRRHAARAFFAAPRRGSRRCRLLAATSRRHPDWRRRFGLRRFRNHLAGRRPIVRWEQPANRRGPGPRSVAIPLDKIRGTQLAVCHQPLQFQRRNRPVKDISDFAVPSRHANPPVNGSVRQPKLIYRPAIAAFRGENA
jgi:hypothetical protein